ncbi:MBOAT family O-acyltransferase [Butyrivibrio sp. NC2002]|uniref:MBOAT family O-acyltransferase n=1 Tax=Butyrivibrio sp. NC2002 TaxID=1410610 RepID=UPI001FA7FEE2|nr:MBOAT family O-acyltransferase [Butyrivibrio sp. NC2002]
MKFKNAVVLIASVVFYSWGGVRYLLLLFCLIIVNYFCGIAIGDVVYSQATGKRRVLLIFALLVDVLNLVIFKYLSFLVSSVEGIITKISGTECSLDMPQLALPIGISFFTFQIMSYVIDVYKGQVEPQKNILKFALYVMMFPRMMAGPIVRYNDVNREIEDRATSLEMIELGIKRFIMGFAKKVFLANAMGEMADAVFALNGGFNTAYAWLGALSYTLQIYYDFSGYSDMAIGLGLVFGFHFSENFNYPYISSSIQEFWRRWHISLSSWFRDYVYIPLGGNRKGRIRTYVNLWTVFLLTGIWHGAAWQFIIWGLYHGLFMFIERLGLGKLLKRVPKVIGHVYALVIVVIGWVFFRADNISIAVNYIQNMFAFRFDNFAVESVVMKLNTWYCFMLMVAVVLACPIYRKITNYKIPQVISYAGYLVLFALGIIYLSGLSYNPFIYVKF